MEPHMLDGTHSPRARTDCPDPRGPRLHLATSPDPGSAPVVVLDPIEWAIAEIAVGRPVVVVDDENRENEGDLIFAAELATPETVAFMVRYTSGYICVPLPEDEADRLELPPMYHTNQDKRGTPYAGTVDARR